MPPDPYQKLALSQHSTHIGPEALGSTWVTPVEPPKPPSYPELEARGFVFQRDLEQRSDAGLVLLPERCSSCGRKHEPIARAPR